MHTIVNQILRSNNIHVSSRFLKFRLESHPDYPALSSIQDTLEELGINAYACIGTIEELEKENSPFLAHLNMGDGEIRFFKSLADARKKVSNFDNIWSGRVMFIEKTINYGNAEHDKQHQKEKRNRLFAALAALLIIGSILALPIYSNNLIVTLLTVSSLIGLYFSWLIIQKELGVSNIISDKICSIARHSHCETVLQSKGSRLFSWLTLGDVGMIYFSSSLIFLLFTSLSNQSILVYYYLSIASLIFPCYSLYYQWQIAKEWCMLCMGVLISLSINAIISFTQLKLTSINAVWDSALLFLLLSVAIMAVWQLLKDIYQKSLKSLHNEIKATRLKRNPKIFSSLLERQPFNRSNLPVDGESLYFGNTDASYQLTIASSPFCGPCSRAHHAIEKLFEKYPEQLGVAIRFSLHSNDDSENSVVAAKHIIKSAGNRPLQVLRDWYETLSVDKIKQLHQNHVQDSDSVIEQHIAWTSEAQITATPTVFVNGRMLPDLYSVTDLIGMVDHDLKQ